MIKAIETVHNGYRFRSRLEARWAVFFDTLGIPYEYEKEGYDLEGMWYLPDFWLPEQKCWVEIKGDKPTEQEREKAVRLAMYTQKPVATFYGNIEIPTIGSPSSFYDVPAQLWAYKVPEYNLISVPTELLIMFQKLDMADIKFYVQENELFLEPVVGRYTPSWLDTEELSTLYQQYKVLTEVRDLVKERKEEIKALLTPPAEEGWDVHFVRQCGANMCFGATWGECEECRSIAIMGASAEHKCDDTQEGQLIAYTPRIQKAYLAARQARFGR